MTTAPSMTKTKWSLIFFAVALVIRLAALASWDSETSLYYVSDSYTYRQIALNLIEHGVYSMEKSETPHPDNFRTPVYPLFLLPFVYFKTSMYWPVVLQIFTMSAAMVWIYRLASRLMREKLARYATLLFALEPFTALISAQLMTEAIFVSLFVPAFLYLALYLKENDAKKLYSGATLLALAALTRPVAVYLFVLLPLLPVIKGRWQEHWRTALAALGIFFVIVSPWLYFTRYIVKANEFSSLSSFDMYAYHGVYFNAWRSEHGAADRLPELDLTGINDRFDAREIPKLKAVGLGYIKAHFPEYLLYHTLRLPRLFTDSGYASLLNGVPALNFSFDSVKGGFVEQMEFRRLTETFLKPILAHPAFIILLAADLFFITIALLAMVNPLLVYRHEPGAPTKVGATSRPCRDKLNRASLLIVLFILAYAVLASPIGGARFRIPINFFLFLLALESLSYLKKRPKTATLPAASQTV